MTRKSFFWFISALLAFLIMLMCFAYSINILLSNAEKLDKITILLEGWEITSYEESNVKE